MRKWTTLCRKAISWRLDGLNLKSKTLEQTKREQMKKTLPQKSCETSLASLIIPTHAKKLLKSTVVSFKKIRMRFSAGFVGAVSKKMRILCWVRANVMDQFALSTMSALKTGWKSSFKKRKKQILSLTFGNSLNAKYAKKHTRTLLSQTERNLN